jgi:hypothetical protein
LRIEFDALRAMQPGKPAAADDSAANVDERVLRYFQVKAAELGLPKMVPLPSRWLRARSTLR